MEARKRLTSGWNGPRRVLSSAFTLSLVCGVLSSGPAGATTTAACGQLISRSTTLDGDVGPCPGFGFIINNSDVTLDLGGHTVFGTGRGVGITVAAGTRVRVQNGMVSGFGAGIGLEGGPQQPQGRVVSNVRVVNNIDFGIDAFLSVENTFTGNHIVNNGGPGIRFRGTFGPASGPSGNSVRENFIVDNGGAGISLGFGSQGNVVARNQVVRNGEQGVVGHAFARSNQVVSNLVAFNGTRGSAAGAGIDFAPVSAPAFQNLVRGNSVMFNAGNGIHMTAGGNEIVVNRTAGNGSRRPNAFDLLDSSPDNACDQNRWSGNTFATAFPSCTTAP